MNVPKPKKKDDRKNKPPEKEAPHPIRLPLIIGVIILALFMATAPFWATDREGAMRTLIVLGFKPISVGGFDPFGCGLDIYATKFTAISPEGMRVKGNVCRTPYVSHSSVEIDTSED